MAKWIQKTGIDKPGHKGALRKQLHVKKGKGIPMTLLEKAAAKGGKIGRRARLAMTLKRMH